MAGYSLKQLLSWCYQDRLIDGHSRDGEFILIRQGTQHIKLPPGKAKTFLVKLLKQRDGLRDLGPEDRNLA